MRLSCQRKDKNLFLRNSAKSKFLDGVKKTGDHGICLYGIWAKGGFDFSMILSAQSPGRAGCL